MDLSKVKTNADGEFNEKDLAKAVNVHERNLGALKLYQEAFMGETAVVYCVGVKHAETVAELFNTAGTSATYIEGNMSEGQRKQILKDYHDGKIKVLFSADLLIVGFDEQSASVCLNLRPTRSQVVAEQRGGRVLRVDDNNPWKHAYIVDFVDKGAEKSGMVLFSKVANGTHIEHKPKGTREGGGGRGGGKRVDLSKIKVEGLEVVVETGEIMELQAKLDRPEKSRKSRID